MFTSKELDEETGLYYFGARYYDPRTSVWQSTDPAIGRYLNTKRRGGKRGLLQTPRTLGLYSYARLNPLIVFDPTGAQDETVTHRVRIREVTIQVDVKKLLARKERPPQLIPDFPVLYVGVGGAAESIYATALSPVTGMGGVGASGGVFFDASRLSVGTYERGEMRWAAGNFAGVGVKGGLAFDPNSFEGVHTFGFADVGEGERLGVKVKGGAGAITLPPKGISGSWGAGAGFAWGVGRSYTSITHEVGAAKPLLRETFEYNIISILLGAKPHGR